VRHSPPKLYLFAGAVLLLACSRALATDWVIGAGSVDPPGRPEADTPLAYSRLLALWGPPSDCEFQSDCTSNQGDVVFYPARLIVSKDRRVRTFSVTARGWRTPSGARVGDSVETLVRRYPSLTTVRNRHWAVGRSRLNRLNYMVTVGSQGLGFALESDRIIEIFAGSSGDVRAALRTYGPI